jgi:uncharacterized membrane protein
MLLEKRRKTVVILAASVACMAAPCAVFARRFPHFVWMWIALMVLTLVYTGVQFAKLKKEDNE